ncbi:MAG: hypothetical protein C0623_03240 [Desulfuromonas sp.]|nr:MAG: hypothetical protein C0623_03240 [Desulfuromonas sp.]
MRWLAFLLFALVLVSACAPAVPPLVLPQDCPRDHELGSLQEKQWLQQKAVWRLHQTMLLETRFRKLAMQGFLRLDLKTGQGRLVAMNEVGLVLFDLTFTADDTEVHRVIPPLQKRPQMLATVGRNLRRIFLLAAASSDAEPTDIGSHRVLTRTVDDITRTGLFDCRGDLRESRTRGKDTNWRVLYNRYAEHEKWRLPQEIILNDQRDNIRLSLEVHEVKLEP